MTSAKISPFKGGNQGAFGCLGVSVLPGKKGKVGFLG